MRLIKMFGLAMVAAVAAMAFIGASSASATVLCETQPTTPSSDTAVCHTGWDIGANAVITGTAEEPELTSTGVGFPNVVCAHSETKATVTNTGGASSTVTGTIDELDFTNCETTKVPKVACTVTVENLPYHAEVHRITNTYDGELTVKTDGNGNPGAKVECVGGVIKCTFSSTLFNVQVDGGASASVTAVNEPLTLTSLGACPNSASWDATYEATGLTTEIWVADHMD